MALSLSFCLPRWMGVWVCCALACSVGMAQTGPEAEPKAPVPPAAAVVPSSSTDGVTVRPGVAVTPDGKPMDAAPAPGPVVPTPPAAVAPAGGESAAAMPVALPPPPPNVVLIVVDDLGYSDLGCFGSKTIRTPNLDKMAVEGTRLTSFHVAQAVCSASRAALMTGCYPNRVGMQGALNHTSKEGISPDEMLMPEMFQKAGYVTGIFGKWHLGTSAMFNPTKHGFDEFWGIPYSNDNSRYHPTLAAEMPPLPVYDGVKVEQTDMDQTQFTKRITEKAVSFIRRHEDRPFFLYVPHVMPHVPIFASERFAGKSPNGAYADVVEELDWSVGMIFAALNQAGVEQNTLVVFMSDNGPFLSYGNHAGTAAPLREGKLTSFQGGVRVPFIARWPGHVAAGVVNDEPVIEMDLLPTFSKVVKDAVAMRMDAEAAAVATANAAPPATPGATTQPTEAAKPLEAAGALAATPGVATSAPPATPGLATQATEPTAPSATVPTPAPVAVEKVNKIDGLDIGDVLSGKAGAKSPHEALVFYAGNELQAVRSGDWVLHFAHSYITVVGETGKDGKPANLETMKPEEITKSGIDGIASRHGYTVAQQEQALYQVKEDPAEKVDVSKVHPEVVERLTKLAEPLRKELGDALTKTEGTEVRAVGKAE